MSPKGKKRPLMQTGITLFLKWSQDVYKKTIITLNTLRDIQIRLASLRFATFGRRVKLRETLSEVGFFEMEGTENELRRRKY